MNEYEDQRHKKNQKILRKYLYSNAENLFTLVCSGALGQLKRILYSLQFHIQLKVKSRRGLGIFLFTTASRTALGPTQSPIQWVPGALSLGVKRPGREADHARPSSAEFEE
jgi:hypothetical protein